jgi:hypothetical protein
LSGRFVKDNVITAAVAFGLQGAYLSAGQFALRHDPWPLLCILTVVLIGSVCGLLRREAQFAIFCPE